MKNALNIIAVIFAAVFVVCAAGCAEKTQTRGNETRGASEQVTPVVATTVPLTATTPTATSAPSLKTPVMNPGKYINSGTTEDMTQKTSEKTTYLVEPAATDSMDPNSSPVMDTVEPAATDSMDSNTSPVTDTVEPAANDSMDSNSSPVIDIVDIVEPAPNDSADSNSSTVIDAVCKMRIDKRTAESKSEYNGKTYYFCSADCKQEFDENPDKYIKAHTGALVAAFNASPTSGNAPLNVAFTDISTGTPTSWNWNFGDGTNSTNKNAVHIYSKKGKYNVALTVRNANGDNRVTKYGYISVDSSKVTDAVCKKKIDKRKAEFKSVYKGKTYYFCSANCKTKFYKNPEKYIC